MARTHLKDPQTNLPLTQLPAAALRACLKEGISRQQVRRDLVAGVLVGIVALPLAMALSIAVGLPPQHGLYTAIIAGALTPLLGGSRLNVVGPTAAFVVILGPIVQTHGLPGLLFSGMLAGLILMGMGALRMGRLIEFIPFPVTTGFTAGIALVIAGLQLKDALGIHAATVAVHFPEKMRELWDARGGASPWEAAVAAATLGILLLPRLPKRSLALLPRWLRRVPPPLLALPGGALLALALEHWAPGAEISTLGERFSTVIQGVEIHGIPRSLPGFGWPWAAAAPQAFVLSWETLRALLPGAVTIAFLGAIESLLCAVVADGMARTRHEPDSELIALGLSNFMVPFFGGIPATGAIARTAANYRFGGRTPLAALAHALTVLLAVLALAPLLAYLPMASMAALLLLVAWNMSEVEHFFHTLRVAPRSDAMVLLICFSLTVLFDMVIAVSVGVLLGALFFIKRMATLTGGRFLGASRSGGTRASLPKGVVIYSINGPLFFGAAERAISALRSIGRDIKVVIFLLEDVMAADMTGLVAMEGVVAELKRHGIKAVLVGAQPGVKELFLRGGLKPAPGVIAYTPDLDGALKMVGAHYRHYRRRDTGPIRLQPLHRQRSAGLRSKRQTG